MYGSYWLTFILLIVGGVISASGVIISKNPNAKEIIDKIVPFKGIIGIILLVFGIIHFIDSVRWWGYLLDFSFFWGLVTIVAILMEIVLGFLLGYSLIAKYALSSSDKALEKGNSINEKLVKIQNPIGIISIVVALLLLIGRIF